MPSLLPLLLVASLAVPAQEDAGVVLHEPSSGASLTLPEDWTFATVEGGVMAQSADERSFVLLAGAEGSFEQIRDDVRSLVVTRLDDVQVLTTRVDGIDERGALEEIVKSQGKGKSKKDGGEVEFAAMVMKTGIRGVLVLGSWRDEASAKLVGDVLASLHVKKSAGEGGLVVTNERTGASVTIPKGWKVVRSRKGMLASSADGGAMAILVGWQGDFDESLQRIRTVLLGWVFKEVELGEFAAVEASYVKDDGSEAKRVLVAASGKAVDRADDRAVEFTALRIQREDTDEGAVLFGAWKDAEHAELVAALLSSIRFTKKADAK